MRWPWSKPKTPVTVLTEIPADYAMMLHALELGSVLVRVDRVSKGQIWLKLSIVRDGVTVKELDTRMLNTHDELVLHSVFLYPQ